MAAEDYPCFQMHLPFLLPAETVTSNLVSPLGGDQVEHTIMAKGKPRTSKKAQPIEVLQHWPKLIETFQFSPQEFYVRVEQALKDRHVPGLAVSRVIWREGGPMSAYREYLRLTRNRLIFDVCAAPFGTGFFVSEWLQEKALKIGLLCWILYISTLVTWNELGRYYVATRMGGPRASEFLQNSPELNIWISAAVALGAAVLIFLRTGPHLDDFLMHAPVIRFFFRRYFAQINFYRADQRCMYQAAVHAAVVQVIDEITKPHGINPLSEMDRRPIFKELVRWPGANGRN